MAFGFPNISFIGYPTPIPCAGHGGLGFREARPADGPALLEHFHALTAEDRRQRFCGSIGEASLAAHVAGLWRQDTVVLSAHDGPLWSGPLYRAGRVRALGEFTIEGSAAELALTVERGMRRRGIGTYLVQTGARLLALRRVRRLVAYTLPDNRSFLTLSSRLGGEIRRGLDEVEVVFDIASLHDAYVRRRLAAQVFEAVAPPVSAGPYGQDALREAV